jgi:hypothetical protein
MKALLVVFLIVLVITDARSVKNLQLRTSRRSWRKAHVKELPGWCTDAAQIKEKIAAETTRCAFWGECLKAAILGTDAALPSGCELKEEERCGRLKALGPADGIGDDAKKVVDMFLAAAAKAVEDLLTGAEDASTRCGKVEERIKGVRIANFGTKENDKAAPAPAPSGGEGGEAPKAEDGGGTTDDGADAADPPKEFLELSVLLYSTTQDAADPAEPGAPAVPEEAPQPKVENKEAPTFCALPVIEQFRILYAFIGAESVEFLDLKSMLTEMGCDAATETLLKDELEKLKSTDNAAYESFISFATAKILNFVNPLGDAAPEPPATPSAETPSAEAPTNPPTATEPPAAEDGGGF